MALDTYSALQTSIADFLNRSDLTSVVPDFITLCEARIRRNIRTRHTSILQATLASGDAKLTFPADIVEVVTVAISGSALGSQVELIAHDDLLEKLRLYTTSGTPRFASIVGEELWFAPLPDADYTIDIEVEGPFVPLSNAAPSNWILADYPDVYLYGALTESAPYLKDDARVRTWDTRFRGALEELERNRDRWKYPSMSVMPIPRTFAEVPPRY